MPDKYYTLYHLWRSGHASEAETAELWDWLAVQSRESINTLLTEGWEHTSVVGPLTEAQQLALANRILAAYPKEMTSELSETTSKLSETTSELSETKSKLSEPTSELSFTPSVHRVHFLKTAWFRFAAAILLFIGLGTYFWTTTTKKNNQQLVAASVTTNQPNISPGSNKAILTLSNGQKIELNNTVSETIHDGQIAIKNASGNLSYESLPIPSSGGVAPGETPTNINPSDPGAGVGYPKTTPATLTITPATLTTNTMSTPRGGQYSLILSDGTKVYLNAESSITYPTTFITKTRTISITGEAYLEVKPDKSKPFIVHTPSDNIEVLGTSFNINAYENLKVKTSLVNGKIKVQGSILQPGQAFQNNKIDRTNIDQDIAWKNGLFDFRNILMIDAMKQLARWYDINVQFDGDFSDVRFMGKIDRSLTLKDVLSGLDRPDMHFTLTNRTLRVHR
jgi:transmembrane sensor